MVAISVKHSIVEHALRDAVAGVRKQLTLIRNELVAGGYDPEDPHTWAAEEAEGRMIRAMSILESGE